MSGERDPAAVVASLGLAYGWPRYWRALELARAGLRADEIAARIGIPGEVVAMLRRDEGG